MKWVSSRGGREGAIKDPPFPQVYVVGGKEREAIGGSAGNWVARTKSQISSFWELARRWRGCF